ncbi:MAG: hypothetical protein M0R80_13385 [Proteobacteria bacterium]|jgi:hypothetical protein|nr:hypothetical protein [Pseudomonadota bacterium]
MINETLNLLAQKLGVGVEILWECLLKQAYIDSMLAVIFILVLIDIFCVTYRLIWKYKMPDPDYYDMRFSVFVCKCLWGFFLVLVTCLVFIELPLIYAGFMNPEYWAIYKILGAMK